MCTIDYIFTTIKYYLLLKKVDLLENKSKKLIDRKAGDMKKGIIYAILAAVFYGVSIPFSKILLVKLSPQMMAALLYMGAGMGMLIVNKCAKEKNEMRLERKDLPYIIGTITLDILAPMLMMLGLVTADPSSASLVNNFEIVVTSIVALFIFGENIDRKTWMIIALIIAASFVLSIEDIGEFKLSLGLIYVIGATICWGFENNCTAQISDKNPIQIVIIKGFGSGIGAFIIAVASGAISGNYVYIIGGLLLGFFSYGLSVLFYIYAQRDLGAARTSAYYAVAPFVGVVFSWILLGQNLSLQFFVGLIIMICATYLMTRDGQSKNDRIEVRNEEQHVGKTS